jgi:FkbM family methyltransferase
MLPPKKIIFDVGANDCSNFIQEVKDNSTTHLHAFEPTPRFFEHFRKSYSHLKNLHYTPFAVGDTEQFTILNVAGQADWGCSSILEFSDKSQTDWDGREDFVVTNQEEAKVIRLDGYIQKNKIPKIDFLHVDTQGFDLRVLKGMGNFLSIVKEGMVEAAAKPDILYYGQNTLEETQQFLIDNGFKIVNVTNNDHLGNEVNIHFVREKKIKIFIVTYNNPVLLNKCLDSIFLNVNQQELSNLQIFIINNHSNFVLNENYVGKVTILNNELRPDFSTGHLSRNWNQAILNGFGDLNDPHCDILITCQDDTIFSNHFINKTIKLHEQYDLVTCGVGDNFVSYTPNAIRRIGLWDERFCGIGYQERDYFLRAIKYHTEKVSINDYWHNSLHNPIDKNDNPIKETLTGYQRLDENHFASYDYHVVSSQIFWLKWGDFLHFNLETILLKEPKLPSFIMYPYFEKEVETLWEQKFLYKLPDGYRGYGDYYLYNEE